VISLPTSICAYSSLKQRVPRSLGYVLESYVKKSFSWFPYFMHVLNEFLLNEKMSFHEFCSSCNYASMISCLNVA